MHRQWNRNGYGRSIGMLLVSVGMGSGRPKSNWNCTWQEVKRTRKTSMGKSNRKGKSEKVYTP